MLVTGLSPVLRVVSSLFCLTDDLLDGDDEVAVVVAEVVVSTTSVVLTSAVGGWSQLAALLMILPVRSCLLSMVAYALRRLEKIPMGEMPALLDNPMAAGRMFPMISDP